MREDDKLNRISVSGISLKIDGDSFEVDCTISIRKLDPKKSAYDENDQRKFDTGEVNVEFYDCEINAIRANGGDITHNFENFYPTAFSKLKELCTKFFERDPNIIIMAERALDGVDHIDEEY